MDDEQCNAVRINELEKRLEVMMRLQDRAVEVAAGDLRTRLDHMNEFRLQLTEQTLTFVTKVEFYWAIGTIITVLIAAFTGIIATRK